ncbi:MAG: hypothetical protein WC787_04475 [Patescibacteria group bacterium]|jgi:hypothetical protein
MDNVIRDASLPSASFILAYGAPSSRGRNPKILALFAGIFALVTIIALSLFIFFSSVIMPRDVAVIAFVKSNQPLPDSLPIEWKEARDAAGPFPAFVGLRRSNDTLVPFAVVPRWSDSASTHKTFFWKTLGVNDAETETTSLRHLADRSFDYLRGSWLVIHPSVFLGDASTHESIGGPFKKSRWRTRASITKSTSEVRSFIGDSYLDLSVMPNAWTNILSGLEEIEYRIPEDVRAQTIRWAHGATSTAIALDFSEPMTSSTRIALAAAAGLYDEATVALPDGTSLVELREPVELLASTTSSEWSLEKGGMFQLKDAEVLFSTGLVAWNQTNVPDSCPGSLVAAFRLEFSGQNSMIFFIEKKGKLEMCW